MVTKREKIFFWGGERNWKFLKEMILMAQKVQDEVLLWLIMGQVWYLKFSCYHSMDFFFLFIGRELTTWLPTNKCFAANNILLIRNWNYALVFSQFNYLPQLRQIIDLLVADKSRYFAQPRPTIVKCLWGLFPGASRQGLLFTAEY